MIAKGALCPKPYCNASFGDSEMVVKIVPFGENLTVNSLGDECGDSEPLKECL
jgi:hypothetical protein